uniref:Uncharacterized protein n=1 Tax=Fagus sylvatica TaxID=28930 RepID=A0A2N9GGH2_FAGSY
MPEQKLCANEGGRAGFIGRRARLARHHHARRVMITRESYACHVAILSFHASPLSESSSIFACVPFSYPIFEGSFGGLPELKMGHAAYRPESSRCLLSNGIKFRSNGGKPPANRELHVVARVVIFSMHPGPARQLATSRKDSAREGGFPDVGFRRSWYRWKACATFSCKVLDSRETELRTERYGPANRGRRSVFGPSEGIFPVRIPARPGKVLTIREFHAVHECVFFPTCPWLRGSTCCESGRLCAQARQRRRKSYENFSTALFRQLFSALADVPVRFRRGRKACATYFLKVQAPHRGELGSARYDLVNEGCWNVPYSTGCFPSRFRLDDPEVARCS